MMYSFGCAVAMLVDVNRQYPRKKKQLLALGVSRRGMPHDSLGRGDHNIKEEKECLQDISPVGWWYRLRSSSVEINLRAQPRLTLMGRAETSRRPSRRYMLAQTGVNSSKLKSRTSQAATFDEQAQRRNCKHSPRANVNASYIVGDVRD